MGHEPTITRDQSRTAVKGRFGGLGRDALVASICGGVVALMVGASYAAVPFYFGGTSLLIVVSVTMDTVAQVQGYLLAHQYEGLIKRSKLRGRKR